MRYLNNSEQIKQLIVRYFLSKRKKDEFMIHKLNDK